MAATMEVTGGLEIEKMSKTQKLAALLIMLGEESAAQIMKNLDEHELEAVTGEMAKLPAIPQNVQRDLLREFNNMAVEATTSVLGGVPFAKNSLERSV
ncbi:MAG: flagellar motor switch protein FliG, partial [Verrucomicrobiales bacterium]|nr:flagellar motor switch protein FliG [Verrucomicrobiales bacterium]